MNPSSFNKSLYVISYDIVKDRARTRVMKILKGYGFHVQKSVFECLLTEVQLKKLLQLLSARIDAETDSVRIYNLCQSCAGQATILGRGEVSEVPLVKVV